MLTEETPIQEEASQEPIEVQVSAERKALVKKTLDTIKSDEKFHEKAFKRMRADMAFVKGRQWPNGTEEEQRYIANITQRHVQQRVAQLYAKNPRAVARRRPTLNFTIWDGKKETLDASIQVLAMASQVPPQQDPMTGEMILPPGVEQAQALLADVQEGFQRMQMIEKIGKTLEIMFHYYLDEPTATFKLQCKQLVRRAVICGVGYVQIGFQRAMEKRPEITSQIADFQNQLDNIEMLASKIAKGEQDYEAEKEELRLSIAELQKKEEVLIREGLVFDFPKATAIIPDQNCTQIKGWIGARHLSRKFLFSKEEILKNYKIDVGDKFTAYTAAGQAKQDGDKACVYEYYDIDTGLMYTACEGYDDFLEEPAAPSVELERFFPIFGLTFNDLETDGDDESDDEYTIFPPSDVRLMRSMQLEYNRAREGIRQHRRANAPKYASQKGMLNEEDKGRLNGAVPHEVVELNALSQGQKIDDVLQTIKHAAIDPALYDTNFLFEDMQRVVGSAEANLGGTSGATATEAGIAEGSRMAGEASSVDDLDDLLTQLARAAGAIMLKEISPQTAKKIAGPGAVWPSLSSEEIAEELYLEIVAGSSGRPNKAQDIANFERMTPILVQIPGISPTWLAQETVRRLDDRIDIEEAIIDGMPSIVSMNAASKPSTGDPANDPAQQGNEGSNNVRAQPTDNGATQPGNPAPMGMLQ